MSTTMPRWDQEAIFPSLDSAEFEKAFQGAIAQVDQVAQLFDEKDVTAGPSLPANEATRSDVEAVLSAFNEAAIQLQKVGAYLNGFISVDARDQAAQSKRSEMVPATTKFSKLTTRLQSYAARLPLADLESLSDRLRDYRFVLGKMAKLAEHQMAGGEEDLAADLSDIGSSAWARLYSNYTSTIEVSGDFGRGPETLPMSALRNLAFDPSQQVRAKALQGELAAWKEHELTLSAAMNAIKGETCVLSKRRGWDSVLSESVFQAHIDHQALGAMLNAARASFPKFREYLRAKAKMLGHSGGLPWYDLFAPVAEDGKSWDYFEAERFVEAQFRRYSSKMGDFARRTFDERWIDAPPMPGKRDGAFCMGVERDISRILMNFKPSYRSVATLAHELGHAYHNLCLSVREPLLKSTPMTLAETASIFCETIVKQGALSEANDREKLEILEASIMGSTQVVVDITSRFLFEKGTIEGRVDRELSATELCELMAQAQRDTYGDGLDLDHLHPYMWAAKPHYYAWRSYYNFPYMFGLLFGLGLYAQYEADPEKFKAGYDDLLSSTGMGDASELAQRFGIDIRSEGFWTSSLNVIGEEIDEFVRLAN